MTFIPATSTYKGPPLVIQEPTIQERIVSLAKEFKADPALALAVAHAESCFDLKAQNPNSSAGGVFQFIDQTWKENCTGDKLSKDNLVCGVKLLAEKEGIKHWEESRLKGCEGGWEKHYKEYKAVLDT